MTIDDLFLKAAALAVSAALFAALSGTAAAQTPECNGTDVLYTVDGKFWCYPEGTTPPAGAILVDQPVDQPVVAPPAATPIRPDAPGLTLQAWAQAAEACLLRESAFAATAGAPGCYAGTDGRLHCSSADFGPTATTCSAEANASGQPARWDTAGN
ncbi:hypothetical protein COU18_03745 [Candidatus Kaiserbacteria bacterium CG10_big_fil_rev_8_21_14_0_10_51_14]|uniref:Uncharacterized protein n=1 Tax=Candidatus Kaiserbacteria bacterium CG10_big_fil_rev_8_21_14_0_10_51_14 TaxID=1974610 RepID=A0A2H0UBG6_9BACT|nr:MAG: hypothetical protein COU18_03745 [Candidatus Kaiserbacteria bacterium CG10_big_fil_rev_8_21_14_0_10_51_14]